MIFSTVFLSRVDSIVIRNPLQDARTTSKEDPDVSATEQRAFPRIELNQSSRLWHPQAGRLYPVKILNQSKTGVFISVSMRCPLRQGQYVELQRETSEFQPEENASPHQLPRVIREDRSDTLEDASIKAGLMFCIDPR